MPLTLKITSKHRHILGADSIHVFSVHGGSIGRAPDNDWVLPDPDRFLSGHHASIDYRNGAYYLTDNSSNGVYVNDSDQPVGRGMSLRLYDGDRLRMGDYKFDVNIVHVSLGAESEEDDATADPGDTGITGLEADRPFEESLGAGPNEAPPRQASPPEPGPEEPEPAELVLEEAGEVADEPPAEEDEFRRTLGPGAPGLRLLEERAEELERKPPEPPPTPDDTLVHPEEEEAAEPETPGVFSETSVLREDYLASEKGIGHRPAPGPTNAERDLAQAVRLMLEATGLDPSRIPPGTEREILVAYGHIVRATVEGVLAILRTRSLIKGQFRLTQTTIQPRDNNPLKFAPSVQEALEKMFYKESDEFMEPLQAVETAFGDVRAHQVAMVVAMKAAFRDLLERLEPDVLEEKFDRGLKRTGGILGGSNKSKYWDLYCDFFQVIAGHSDENFAQVVGPKFAEAYDKEIYRLTGRGLPPRRMVDS